MNVLITGGCGFIGSNLVRQLNRSQAYGIHVLDNLSRGKIENLEETSYEHFDKADIRNYESIIPCFKNIDAVVHLAAYGSVVESVKAPEENFDINVSGTFNVLRAAALSGVGKLVFASTGGALIGNATPPVNESSVPRPISPYGASKLSCEGYCSAFSSSYDMSITALRFANVIGPYSEEKKGAVTAFMKAINAGKPIEIYGDGSASRDFLNVEDLCAGIRLALESNKAGYNVYHLASGRETTVKELAQAVMEAAGVSNYPFVFHDKRHGEVDRNFATYDLAKRELNFTPEYSLEETLAQTWNWFKSEVGEFKN